MSERGEPPSVYYDGRDCRRNGGGKSPEVVLLMHCRWAVMH